MIDNLPQGTNIQYLPLAYDDETNAVLVEALKTEFLPTKVSVFQDYVVLEF
jgi:hypothetical protein